MLAVQAGVAIENARLYEETRRAQDELARLELLDERERIAKELHDGVIQSLFAVGMGLQGTAAMASDDGHRPAHRARDRGDRPSHPGPAQLHLRAAAGGAGRPAARPGRAPARPRVRGTHRRAHDHRRRHRRRGRAGQRGERRRPDRAGGAVEREPARRGDIVPHHACGARSVEPSSRSTTTGWGSTRPPRAGMGMDNLRGRVLALGGELTIDSVLGEGATIRASLPL